MKYHKIDSIYKRHPKGHPEAGIFILGEFATPEIEFLQHNLWTFNEKIDGTNIRIGWDGKQVSIGGRTDRAEIPKHLKKVLLDLFPDDALASAFSEPDTDVTLFGEGCGAKIQKGGGNYKSDGAEFVLFDVRVGDWWLKPDAIKGIAGVFGVKSAPFYGEGTIHDAISRVKGDLESHWGPFQAEGLILRPKIEMTSRSGHRIITKVKCRDFRDGLKANKIFSPESTHPNKEC